MEDTVRYINEKNSFNSELQFYFLYSIWNKKNKTCSFNQYNESFFYGWPISENRLLQEMIREAVQKQATTGQHVSLLYVWK